MSRTARVIFSYAAEQEGELSLEVGDIITNIVDEDMGWCEGELNGKKGAFPNNFVEEVVSPDSSSNSVAGKKAKVTFDYEAQEADELTLKLDDIVDILGQEEREGWWKGQLGDRIGVFPSNFVEIIDKSEVRQAKDLPAETPKEATPRNEHVDGLIDKEENVPLSAKSRPAPPLPLTSPVKKANERAKVTFAYEPEYPDGLKLVEGDIITILNKDITESEGSWEGGLNGKVGMFTNNFVELLPPEEEAKMSNPTSSRSGFVRKRERNPARPWSGDIHTSAPCEYSESIALRLKRSPRFRNRANRSRRHLRGKGAGGTDAGPSAATAAGSTTGGSLARADNTPTNRIPDDDLTMYLPDPPGFRWLSKGEDESKTGKANVHEEDLKLSDESQKPTDTEVTVPSEIQARAQLAYIDVLKNGKVKVYRTRIMLLGQDRAGKTSLKKSFLGLPFDHGEPSTDGITVDQSKFEINVDQVKNWVQTGEKPFVSQFANDLAKMVADKLKNEQAVVRNEVDQVMTVEQIDENEDVPQSANDFAKILTEQAEGGDEDNFEDQYRRKKVPNRDETATNVATDVSTVQEESEGKEAIISDPALPPEEFTQFLVQHWQSLSLQSEVASIENYMTLDLWDFAGQHLYYSSYPVFLSSRAVYMLVYNMSKDLQCTAEPCVRVGNVDSHLKNPNGETNLENLLSWLLTVVTMCAGQPTANYVRPPVFIVGTHADQPCQDIKEMELLIKMALYGNDLDHHVIREGVIQNYFSVDNRLGSSCSGVRTLQKKIIEVLKQEPYMGEEVPARWFLFEKVIQALVTESKKYSLNRKLLNKIIQKYCFIDDEDEVDKMLNFYHGLGIIVRHGSTVVLQSQWLIDVFRQLITIRSYKDMETRYSRFWKDLEDTGVLSMQLVDFVFSKLGQQGVIREDILAMMEQFGLIVKFQYSPGDEQYFVPSLLKTPPDPLCNQEPSPTDPCALYITFLSGFVPHGLYSQLVSRCTKWCSDRGVEYAPNFFDGAARFVVEKEFLHQLILLSKKKFIKISLKLRESSDQDAATEAETARLVRGFLDDELRIMTQEVPWFKNLKYKLCVECPYCPKDGCPCRNHGKVSCNHEDCICLLKLPESTQPVYCQKSFSKKLLKPINMDKWCPVKGIKMPACASSESGSPVYTPRQTKEGKREHPGTGYTCQQCKKRKPKHAGTVKEGNPSDYELEVLSQKILHWKSLGRRLNFYAADLHGFDNENSEWREKAYAMLLKWKQREGRDATYQVLYEALCNECVQRTDLAQEFCCYVEGK